MGRGGSSSPIHKGSCSLLFPKQSDRGTSPHSVSALLLVLCFQEFCKTPEQKALDLYPEPLRAEIDELNSWIYP